MDLKSLVRAKTLFACPRLRLRNRIQGLTLSRLFKSIQPLLLPSPRLLTYLIGILGGIMGTTGGAQVRLPPVVIEARPQQTGEPVPFEVQQQSEFLGTLKSEDQQPKYLGSHWAERFGSLNLWGIQSHTLEIPALDLGLLDPRFFSSFSESLFASHLTLNLYPTMSEPPQLKAAARVGTDLSEDTFYRHDKQRDHERWRFQFSQKISGENRSYYDDRQTFFTSSDDVIQTDPRTGMDRVQVSLTYQEETPTHQHATGILLVQKHENLLPYPPAASEATQSRLLVLGNSDLRWKTCGLLEHPCHWELSVLGYQSSLQDPGKDLFLGFERQDLKHATAVSRLQVFVPWLTHVTFEPKLHLQAGFSDVDTQDLSQAHTTLQNWRFQLGSTAALTGLWGPWLWQPQLEAHGVSDSLGNTHQWDALLNIGQTLRYVFQTHHELWTHTGFSQRAASFFERFGSFGTVRGNPNLNPEDTWSVQVGSQHRFSFSLITLKLSALGFFHYYRNLIHFQPNAQLVYIPQNIGLVTALGTQSLLQAEWLKYFESSVKLNWIRPRDITGAPSTTLPGISELGGTLTQFFFWSQKSGSVWMSLRYQQGMSFDAPALQPFPDSWVTSIGSYWKISKTPLALQIDIENVFDQLSGQAQWPTVNQSLTLPILERWGLPQRGRVIFASLLLSEQL